MINQIEESTKKMEENERIKMSVKSSLQKANSQYENAVNNYGRKQSSNNQPNHDNAKAEFYNAKQPQEDTDMNSYYN